MKIIDKDTPLTTGQVARLLRVSSHMVATWIDSGQLRGYRLPVGNSRLAVSNRGKGDRRVLPAEAVRFLEKHKIPVPPELRGCVDRRVLLVGCLATTVAALTGHLGGVAEVRAEGSVIAASMCVPEWGPTAMVLDFALGRQVCREMMAACRTRPRPPRLVAIIGDDVDPADVMADGYAVVLTGTAGVDVLAGAVTEGVE